MEQLNKEMKGKKIKAYLWAERRLPSFWPGYFGVLNSFWYIIALHSSRTIHFNHTSL